MFNDIFDILTNFAPEMRKIKILIVAVAAVAEAPYASADDIAEPTDSAGHVPHRLREIEVLGVKQSPDATLASSVEINRRQVERLGAVAMKDVSAVVPNLYMPDYGTRMTSSIYVRGLGTRIDQPVVGLTVDGVTFLNKDNYDFDIPDIERVEVLRGAQSVLGGRNTMGGQINVYTISPWRYRGVRAMAEYGRANAVKAAVSWYGRLSSTVATSVGAYFTMTDGYWRNDYNNARVGTERQGSARWKLSWRPVERLSVTNTASLSLSRQSGYPYESVSTHQLSYNDTCYYRRNAFADGLTIAYSGNRITANLITSVQYLDDDMTLDQDFTPEDYFTLTQKRREWAVTQDVFCKASRGAYKWLGGVFASYRTTDMTAPVTFYDTGISSLIEEHRNAINPEYPITWSERSFVLGSDFDSRDCGVAIYHESTYTVGDFTLQGGLRWDIEHTALDYRSYCNTAYDTWHAPAGGERVLYAHTPVVIDDSGSLDRTFNQLLPKVAVSYAPKAAAERGWHVTAVASFSKGFKAGGYNTQMFSDVLQQRIMGIMGLSAAYDVDKVISYKPEKSWNYELSLRLKDRSLGAAGAISAELTGFFIDCTDQQLTVFPEGTTTGRVMTNAGRTYSRGAELTLSYRSADSRLRTELSYGYTCATFKEYDNGRRDFSGYRVPYAPAHTLFVSADYSLPVGSVSGRPLTLGFGANVRGVGNIYWDEANTLSQPFYALLGADVRLQTSRWSATVWARNISATRYDTFYFVSMGNAFVQRGKPFAAGVTLRLSL